MKKFIFLCMVIFETFYAKNLAAFPWPYANPDGSSPTNNQQLIRTSAGGYRNTNGNIRFHTGIDIVPVDSNAVSVFSVNDGTAVTIRNRGTQDESINIDDIHYQHIVVDENIFLALQSAGTVDVLQGDFLGILYDWEANGTTGITNHVHLGTPPLAGNSGSVSNPLTLIQNLQDVGQPSIDLIRFFQDGVTIESQSNTISGRIDIRALGRDSIDAVNSAGTTVTMEVLDPKNGGEINPYKAGYIIYDASNSSSAGTTLLDKYTTDPTILFDSIYFNTDSSQTHGNYPAHACRKKDSVQPMDGRITTTKNHIQNTAQY